MIKNNRRCYCLQCKTEFIDEELNCPDVNCCPKCQTTITPVWSDEDINVTINWFSLRVLCNWAVRWSDTCSNFSEDARLCLFLILKDLVKYRPPNSPALTVYQEVKELQKQFPGARLYDEKGETIIPPSEEFTGDVNHGME